MIRSTIISMRKEKSLFTVYFKIIANHLQLIALIYSFDLDWPDQIGKVLRVTYPAADVSSQLFSVDCLVYYLQMNNSISTYYFYLLIYSILPFFVILMVCLIWFCKYRKNMKLFNERAVSSIIIILFFIHPTIANVVFQNFMQALICKQIQQQRYLVQDFESICFRDLHFYFSLFVGFPALALWVIGIPLFAWCLMREQKQRLMNMDVKQKYGFLYNGYKLEAYYWECVIMFRKIAIIFIRAFLSSWGSKIQAYVTLIVLLMFLLVSSTKKPYLQRRLNKLEILSLTISMITVYLGIYFITSSKEKDQRFNPNKDFIFRNWAKWVFFSIIVMSNIYFGMIWLSSIFNQMRNEIRRKYPRCFICLFACCKRNKLLREEIYQKHEHTINQEIDQVDKIIGKLTKLKQLIDNNKNQIDQKSLRSYIMQSKFEIDRINNQIINNRIAQKDNKYHIKRSGSKNLALETESNDDNLTLAATSQAFQITNQTNQSIDDIKFIQSFESSSIQKKNKKKILPTQQSFSRKPTILRIAQNDANKNINRILLDSSQQYPISVLKSYNDFNMEFQHTTSIDQKIDPYHQQVSSSSSSSIQNKSKRVIRTKKYSRKMSVSYSEEEENAKEILNELDIDLNLD